MNRPHLNRIIAVFLTTVAWVFLLLSLASFHSTDWPSHDVYPYPPAQNLCGPVGAFIAYYLYLAIGQGIFPILIFSGVCLFLYVTRKTIGDLWIRAIGLLILSIAFSAIIHNIWPNSSTGFPEGQGGILGIVTSNFFQSHFNTTGARLWLLTVFVIGLLLAADELVLNAPAIAGMTINHMREAKGDGFALPKFNLFKREIGLKPVQTSSATTVADESGDEGMFGRLKVLLRNNKVDPDLKLSYEDDEPAVEVAHTDAADPGPSAPAVIPPPPEPVSQPLLISQSEPAAQPEAVIDDTPAIAEQIPTEEPQAHEALKEIKVNVAAMTRPKPSAPPPPKELGDYTLPDWDCLADAEPGFVQQQETFVREKARILEQALKEFNVDAHVVSIDTGPVITMYELSLAPGIKVATITALSNDIARALAAVSVRIVAPVPGKSTVGIEVPNAQKEKVRFKDLMQLAPEATQKMRIPLFLGKDASGEPLVTDLAAMPHCLIAGTTGSGKSVCINTIIMSVLYTQRPDMVKLILIDPKVVEMAAFKDIPHLMCPVINDCNRAAAVLDWAVNKMEERYGFLAEAQVKNIADYNRLSGEELMERFKPGTPEEAAKIPKKLPYIIIVIDELADLMMTAGKEVEQSIVRIAQKARAVGIHLILATQRPQANVVTGLIKSNMPSRLTFRVQSRMDSRIVLDQNGAELLLGQGDMLFLPNGANKPLRAQGTYLDDLEIRSSVKKVKTLAEAQYEPELVQIRAVNLDSNFHDDMWEDAVRVVLESKRGSVSLIQRKLGIGYARASRIIEHMANCGIVGEFRGEGQPREATMTLEEYDAMKAQKAKDEESGMTV